MIKVIKHEDMGRSDRGWLHSQFHFSFAEYYNPENIKFGALRVVNDDRFDPHGGFDTHPHDNMEIISYVVDGELTHRDSLGNGSRLGRGDVQYMSAGSGIMHSEFNDTSEPLRFLQIWILPDTPNVEPAYGDHRFNWEDRVGKWMPIASGDEGFAPILIHQDMKVLVSVLGADEMLYYDLDPARQAYLIQIEGEGMVNGNELREGDAAEITATREVTIRSKTPSHYILFDMPADEG
jgi:quercetin 2,3-dioxygenase